MHNLKYSNYLIFLFVTPHPANAVDTPENPAQRYVTLCKAAGDNVRLDVLRVLRQESMGVLELCRIFDIPQPRMSHHLKIMLNAGLVRTKREAANVFYRRAVPQTDDPVRDLHAGLLAGADQLPLTGRPARRLTAVHRERARQSRAFFSRHASELREHQARIAEYPNYAECFDSARLQAGLDHDARVLEVGPGDSPLLTELAAAYNTVTALDNVPSMLDLARQRAAATNVTFLEGDLESLSGDWDLIVLNMVLHHMPSPANAMATCAARLSARGTLLLADLCAHDQAWARKACGDRWLGFEPAEVTEWANAAGLITQSASFVAMKNGFQVQVHAFSHADQPHLHSTRSR